MSWAWALSGAWWVFFHRWCELLLLCISPLVWQMPTTSSASPLWRASWVVSTITIPPPGNPGSYPPTSRLPSTASRSAGPCVDSSSSDGWVIALDARKHMGVLLCSWSLLPSLLGWASDNLPRPWCPHCANSSSSPTHQSSAPPFMLCLPSCCSVAAPCVVESLWCMLFLNTKCLFPLRCFCDHSYTERVLWSL